MSAAELELILKKISDRQDIYRSKIEKWSRHEDMGDEIKQAQFAIDAFDYWIHDIKSAINAPP